MDKLSQDFAQPYLRNAEAARSENEWTRVSALVGFTGSLTTLAFLSFQQNRISVSGILLAVACCFFFVAFRARKITVTAPWSQWTAWLEENRECSNIQEVFHREYTRNLEQDAEQYTALRSLRLRYRNYGVCCYILACLSCLNCGI